MKTQFIFFVILLLIGFYKAQVGINTNDPKATLDIRSSNELSNSINGILIPRLTGDQITEMSRSLTADNISMMVYASSAISTPNSYTNNITNSGFYYWNGTSWINVSGVKENFYNSDGQIESTLTNRTVDLNGKNLVFSGNGNVGIGTETPSHKLDVVGTVKTAGVDYNSDKRLKRDIVSLNVDKVSFNSVNPVSYYWNTEGEKRGGTKQLQYGFIAQEIESIYPNLVTTDSNGYKSVSYTALIPILVKNVQELNENVDKLKQEVEKLENK